MPDKTPLQLAKEALDSVIAQKKLNQELIKSLGPAIIDTLKPILDGISLNSKLSKEELISAISNIKIDVPKSDIPHAQVDVKIPEIKVPTPQVTVNIPDIKVPEFKEIKIPKIVVPKPEVTVNIPTIKIPEIKMPEEMDIKGWVQLQGVNLENPLPVQLRDSNGKPVNLLENLTTIVGGSGGGGPKIMKVSDIANSAYGVLINPDGRLRMSAETGGTGLTDTELRASSVPVSQVSGAQWSVNVVDVFATTAASSVVNPDNRVKTELVGTLTVSATDLDVRDLVNATDSVSVYQSSGANWSVSVNDAFRTTVASNLINADDRLRVSVETGGSGLTDTELRASSVPISQVSGANWSVNVQDVFATTVSSNVVNPDNRVKVELVGSQIVTATDLDIRDLVNATDSVSAYQVSGATWSVSVNDAFRTTVASNLINADDRLRVSLETGGSGLTDSELRASAVPVSQVSGANWSVSVTQNFAEDVAHTSGDSGFLSLSVRNSTNTTFAADGDYQPIATDGIGRIIVQPFQTRGLIATAYISPTTGVETTLLAGVAGIFHDCIMITFANQSSATVDMDIRDATGGGVVASLTIPGDATIGWAPTVAYPQNFAADTWTVDNTGTDISGTTVNVTGLFVKNV